MPPHPRPLSPEYRGEGRKHALPAAALTENPMPRKVLPPLFVLACLAVWALAAAEPKAPPVPTATPQTAAEAQWIWFDEGNPAAEAPAETRYFRRVFEINRPVSNPIDEAALDVTADNAYTVWVNG